MAKRKNNPWQERVALQRDHNGGATTFTIAVLKVPTGKRLRVDSVEYFTDATLAQDNTNSFAGLLKNGSTTVATLFDTGTGGATITANTAAAATLSATDASLVLAAADTLTAVFTETGNSTLPAGRLMIYGRWVS